MPRLIQRWRSLLAVLMLTAWAVSAQAQTSSQQAAIAQRVESTLYRQRALLDNALAAIKPSQPGKIQLYFLGVAGDGTQEVFRREIDFVQTQFARDFDTAGHTLLLVNSRTTADSLPMATRTSLREGLQTIAQRMDRDNDILFLFLTSHGSRDHQLMLAQEGMSLADLPANMLATLVRQTHIRWKVIVVSACYAGGFINPLQDDHTLIITAARADRSSFGCEDENDFTYFGRAFFKEALPRSATFEQAFRQASVLINRWEIEDRKNMPKGQAVAHSFPQMSAPAAVTAYLARWRAQLPPK